MVVYPPKHTRRIETTKLYRSERGTSAGSCKTQDRSSFGALMPAGRIALPALSSLAGGLCFPPASLESPLVFSPSLFPLQAVFSEDTLDLLGIEDRQEKQDVYRRKRPADQA